MKTLETFLKRQLSRLTRQQLTAFVSAIIVGFAGHCYIFTNSLLYHDGILSVHTKGATFSLGRWGLGFIEFIEKYTLGSYGSSFFHGLLSIILIANSSILIIDILHIKTKMSAAYIGAIMTVFPVVTSVFAYMYTAAAYWIALLCNVLAVYIVLRHRKHFYAVLLLTLGLGLYQAFFAVAISLFLLSMITDCMNDKMKNIGDILKQGLSYMFVMLSGLVLYLLINATVIKLLKVNMSSYKGADQMGKIEIQKIPDLLWKAYEQFGMDVNWSGINNALVLRLAIWGIILITILLFATVVCRGGQKNSNKIGLIILLCLTPAAFNGAYLFSTSASYSVHTLMRYSLVFALIMPIVPLEYLEGKQLLGRKGSIFVAEIMLPVLLWGVSGCYLYNNNVAYMKENFLQEQAISYYTVLISEIKGADGYADDLPVAYIGERNIADKSVITWPQFERVQITGYKGDISDLLNNYAWRIYMGRHCGFYPEVLEDTTEIERLPEVKEMPCYPDKGSIKIVNGVAVVKFAEADMP